MCMAVLYYVVSVLSTCPVLRSTVSRSPEEGVRSLGMEFTGGCEPPHGCWELKLDLLQSELLTTKPSLQVLAHSEQ